MLDFFLGGLQVFQVLFVFGGWFLGGLSGLFTTNNAILGAWLVG